MFISWISKSLREKYQHVISIINRHITVQGHYPKKDTSKYLDAIDGFRSAPFFP